MSVVHLNCMLLFQQGGYASMKFYILRSDGAYISFEGMSQDVIISMLTEQGLSCTFIDQATFNTAAQNKF